MTTRVWTMKEGAEYNSVMDGGLRVAMRRGPRALQQREADVREAAEAILRLAYLHRWPSRGLEQIARDLQPVLAYEPRRGSRRVLLPPDRRSVSRTELRKIQTVAQAWLAHLVLAYKADNAESLVSVLWSLPKFEGRMEYLRTGIWTLWDLAALRPPWIRYAFSVGYVLGDATPWLRFCALCGHLFFRVKRQRWCSRGCASVAYSRRQAKDPGAPRGPRRTPFEAPHVEAHNEWLRIARTEVPRWSARSRA